MEMTGNLGTWENFEKIVDSAVTQGDVQRVGEIEVVGPHDDLQHRKSVFFQKIALKEPISKTYNYMPNKSYEKNFSVSPDGHADRTNASSYPWSPAMSEHAVYENTKPFSMGFAFWQRCPHDVWCQVDARGYRI